MTKRQSLFAVVVTVLVAVDLYLIFGYAPIDAGQGMVQKIFYWHVASAFTSFTAFVVAGIFALLYLIKRNPHFDTWELALVEVGFLFCTIVLFTGPIWAKPMWGVWWTWEPRLTSTLFMWLIFISYFILRGSFTNPDKKRIYCAVLAIFGCLDIPIIIAAVKLWRGVHPVVLNKKTNLPGTMWITFIFTLVTVLLLAALFTTIRVSLEKKRLGKLERG